MAHKFSTDTLRLTRQTVTATGNNLYVNGLLVGSGLYATVIGLTESGIQLGSKIDLLSGYGENFFVHRLGDESITGIKSFATTGINVHGNPFLTGLIPGTNITVQNNGDGTFTINSTAQAGTGTADLTNVVFTSGEQIISGVKSFSTGIIITGTFEQGSQVRAIGQYSHAQGFSGQASGNFSHAEGRLSVSFGQESHAEGFSTLASGQGSHAEGFATTSIGVYSHAEGDQNIARGSYSHAEGATTTGVGISSHSEGQNTQASGNYSHAEGDRTDAVGTHSHAEGVRSRAFVAWSHAEGFQTVTSGIASHAEGVKTAATGIYSHAEGTFTTAEASGSHAEGLRTISRGVNSHAEGYLTIASGIGSHAEGNDTDAVANYSHAEGESTTASGLSSHAEGQLAVAIGNYSHAEGQGTSRGNYSHAEGSSTIAFGTNSHAEGSSTIAARSSSHSEGSFTIASGNYSHAEGHWTTGYGDASHAEGQAGAAFGNYSHVEGLQTITTGLYSHAEGHKTFASGYASHAEGGGTSATGIYSHAEGSLTIAERSGSHAEGLWTIADRDNSHAQGKYNRTGVSGLFQVGFGFHNTGRADAIYVSDTNSNPSILSGNWLTETGFLIADRRPITGAYGATVNNDGTLTITAGGGAPQDVVYTSGDQAITGIKTFVTTGINILGEPILTGIIGGINITVQDNNNGTFTVNASSIDGSVISGNLTQSGVQLGSKIDSLSGYGENFFVHRIGNESITGIKTFATTGLNVMGEIVLTGIVAGTNITIQDNNNGTFTLSATSAPGGDAITGIRVTGSNSIIGEFNIIKSGEGVNVTLSGDRTLVISSPAVASLGTIFVSDLVGTDSRGTVSPYNPNVPFKTIAAAENASLDFDTIYIYSGVYTGANLGKNNIDYYFSPNSWLTGSDTIFTDGGSAKNMKILGEGNFATTSTYLVNFSNSESNLKYEFKSHARGNLTFLGDRIYVNGEHFGGDASATSTMECYRSSEKTGSFVDINIKTILNGAGYFDLQKVKLNCMIFSGVSAGTSFISCVGNRSILDFTASKIGNVTFNPENQGFIRANVQEANNVRPSTFNAGAVDYRFGELNNTSLVPTMSTLDGKIRIDKFFSQREPYISTTNVQGRHLEVDIGYYSGVRFEINLVGPNPTASNVSFLTLKGNYVITGINTAFFYNPSAFNSGNLILDNVSILTNAVMAFSGSNATKTGLLNVKGTLLTNRPLINYVLKRGIIEIDPDLSL